MAEPERPGHGAAGSGRAGAGPAGGSLAVAGNAGETLGQVVACLQGGAGMRGFQAGIEAGQRVLGNRAFVNWVGALQCGGREAGAGAPLQLMGKKRKNPDAGAGPSGEMQGPAAAGTAEDTGATPVKKAREESRAPPPREARREGAGEQTLRSQAGEHELELAVIAPVKSKLTPEERELFEACLKGVAVRFRLLFRYGNIDVNIANASGTLLCHAAYGGQKYVVRELLAAPGINVNLAGQQGATPLTLAAQGGHVELVKLLLGKHGINVNLATVTGLTALNAASERGHTEVVKLLLAAPGMNVNIQMPDGVTPLHIAAEMGHVEVVKLLLAAPRIDIDRPKANGATVLYTAVRQNFPGIVEQLVRGGADVNLGLADGTTPLYLASYNGCLEVVSSLLQAPGMRVNQGAGGSFIPLGAAAQRGHRNIVRLLLGNGADPNMKDSTGLTALHAACLAGDAAIAEALLHFGADPDAEVTDLGGQPQTPDRVAEHWDQREVMSVLAVYRRRREAGRRLERLPIPEQAAEHTGTPPSVPGTEPPTTLAQAQDALTQELQDKLLSDCIDRREGMQLLETVNSAADLDSLCVLYRGLAHIERARRRGPAEAAGPVFDLGGKAGLNAEALEREIKGYLGQAYHRFAGQAVNDMEFGRGKPVTWRPGLLHASAGVPGMGRCSVFYFLDATRNRIRIVGIGHQVGHAMYRLDYAAAELGKAGRVVRID